MTNEPKASQSLEELARDAVTQCAHKVIPVSANLGEKHCRNMESIFLSALRTATQQKDAEIERLNNRLNDQSVVVTRLCLAIDPECAHGPESEKIAARAAFLRERVASLERADMERREQRLASQAIVMREGDGTLVSTVQQWEIEREKLTAEVERLKAERLLTAQTALDAADKQINKLTARVKELEAGEFRLVDQRDSAEAAISDAYKEVTGRTPEWSSLFGYVEAVHDISETIAKLTAENAELRLEVKKARTAAHSSDCECNDCIAVADAARNAERRDGQ